MHPHSLGRQAHEELHRGSTEMGAARGGVDLAAHPGTNDRSGPIDEVPVEIGEVVRILLKDSERTLGSPAIVPARGDR